MTTYNPFSTNPVVPAVNSFTEITLGASATQLVWPSAFIDGENNVALYMNITSTANDQILQFPDARLVGPGNGALLINKGDDTFDVQDATGASIIDDIAAGEAWLIFLTDNTTEGGTWTTIQMGATTSAANAADLEGFGLIALSGTLNIEYDVTTLNTPTTLGPTNRGDLINWTGGSDTVTLPKAGQVPTGYGIYVRNSSATGGTLTLDTGGSELIDGSATFTMEQGQSAQFIFDGTNYYSVGFGIFAGSEGVELTGKGVLVVDGTESEPSYSFINYTSTGFYTQGTDDVSFTSGGTLTVTFDSAGIDVVEGEYTWDDIPLPIFSRIYP